MKALKILPVLALLASGWTGAHAAADFTTIKRTQSNLSDATPKLVVSFTLPSNVSVSTSTSGSAVLDLEVLGSEFNYNEVYINPPSETCNDDGAEDASQSRSIGMLQEHDDDNLKTEWAANHIAFSSSFLQSGTNKVMICVRNIDGNVGSGAGNLDDISVRSIVLHYHTTG